MQILLCVPDIRWICDPTVSFSWYSFMISLKGVIRRRHICIHEFIKILIAAPHPILKGTCLMSIKLRLILSLISLKKTLLLKWDCILKIFISLCVCPICVQEPMENRRGGWMTWYCSYKWLWSNWYVSLEWNWSSLLQMFVNQLTSVLAMKLGSSGRAVALLTLEPSLQP